MDLDKEFVRAVLRGGSDAFIACQDRGIDAETHLADDGQEAWKYVVEHWKQYGELPVPDIVAIKVGCDLTAQSESTYEFFLDEIFKRRTSHLCHEACRKVTDKLDERDPLAAAEALAEIHHKIQDEHLSVKKVESLLSLGKDVIKAYDAAKAGVRGIPTPWPSMDDQTLGWWPEDLVLFVGRLGVGKTWVTLIVLHEAWKNDRRVLLVSTEMNKLNLAMRFFALNLRMPYDDIRRGRLGEFVEEKFYAGVNELIAEEGLDIVSGDFDYTIDNIEAAVDRHKPDILGIDGPYLIKNEGKDRHERVSNTFDDFKRIGRKHQNVTIANLQFNRSAKTGQGNTIAAENIGITDVAGWNSDVVYGLLQTEDMKNDWEMGVKALKIREGKPDEFKIHWNHKDMDFSEIVADDGDGDGDSGSSSSKLPDDDYDDVPF